MGAVIQNGNIGAIIQNGIVYAGSVSEGNEGVNILKGTTEPTVGKGSNGQIYLKYNSSLPNGYTRLEYIQSNGNQYINTGVAPNSNIQVELKYQFDRMNQNYDILIGSRGSNDSMRFFPVSLIYSVEEERYVMGSQGSPTATYFKNSVRELIFNNINHEVIVDGEILSQTLNPSTFSENLNNMYLFAVNDDGVANYKSSAKIYYCKITDLSNNSVLREFIPCKRDSDDEIGMYELTNNIFYGNIGSGNFTSGIENKDLINNAYAKVNNSWQNLIGTDINDINTIGGGSNVSNVSKLTETKYENLSTKDNNTIYIITPDNRDDIILYQYQGNDRITSKDISNYEFWYENVYLSNSFSITTNVNIGGTNYNRDWQIEMNLEKPFTASNITIIGFENINSDFDQSSGYDLQGFNLFGTSSQQIVQNFPDKDIIIKKENGTVTVTADGVQTFTSNVFADIDANMILFNYYSGNYYWQGWINYIGFKWLS